MRSNAKKKNSRGDKELPGIRPADPPAPALTRSCRPVGQIRLGVALGELVYRLDTPHRRIVQRNLRFAFPSWKEHDIRQVSRCVFHNIGRTLVEMLQYAHMSRADILSRCKLKGETHLNQALEAKRGMVIVSAHLGNWEIGLQYLACRFGKQVHVVVRPLVPRWLDRWVNHARTRFGNHLIPKKKAFARMLKAVREGGIVVLMVDLSSRKQSVAVDYFGHRARASAAAAMLAARCAIPILPGFTLRNADSSFTMELSAPVPIQRSGSLKNDLQCNTQRIADIVEEAVRRHPDQYFWVQKRWKDYHPYLYPGYRPRPEHLED